MLLERFLEDPPSAREDPYEHVALILTNITRLPGGRRLLLAPGRRTLAALACQLAPARSRLRRSGCASALRNCCFRAEVRVPCCHSGEGTPAVGIPALGRAHLESWRWKGKERNNW